MPTRRRFLTAGGLALASLAVPRRTRAGGVVEIMMRSTARGEEAWFEPIGVRIEPGQTVRWIMASPGNPHTTTAYHPKNANHSLRIPETATPWDSGFLVNPRDTFEVTLTVEGVYDYFCLPHEAAGMVGRIVVGRPGGPGTLPLGLLRERLVTITPGQKIAYVTDAADTPANRAAIVDLARGADTLFIEAVFPEADAALAADRAHLTTTQAGELARLAGAARVEPFHFSPRYAGQEAQMLAEVEAAFRGP